MPRTRSPLALATAVLAENRILREAVSSGLVAALYYSTARIGLLIQFRHIHVTPVWPPSGVAVALLLLLGRRHWPALAVSEFLANLTTGVGAPVSAGVAAGHIAEYVLAAEVLRRASLRVDLARTIDVLLLAGVGGFLAPIVGASLGTGSLWLGGVVATPGVLGSVWTAWWLGDGIGIFVFGSVCLVAAGARHHGRVCGSRCAEAVALGVVTVAASGLVFAHSEISPSVLFPLTIWAAVRFEQRGAAAVTAGVSVVATWATVHGWGPFEIVMLNDRLTRLQLFVAAFSVTAMTLGAAIAGRRQSDDRRIAAQAETARLESQLHQSQRMESLGQLAGGVAHDFNNLLAVILNYASFVAEEVGSASRSPERERWEAVYRDIEQVQRAAQQAALLTSQLLVFGRREVVQPQVLSLNDTVRDVERLLRRTLGEEVRLVTELAEGSWPILADPGQIEQVLVNLAINARDAMPEGGLLTIETANLVVDRCYAADRPGLEPGRYVRLRVSDTGTGMDPAIRERAFEPFFTTKPKGRGSGLGLATVHGVVTQARGHVEIYSRSGLGTTLKALLPASEEPMSRSGRPAHRYPSAGGETVLVVEDEDAIRKLTERILMRNGYAVITAADGSEAITVAQRYGGEIHVLVTDVIMPGMLGMALAESLLAMRPNLRVLYMSGYAQPVLTSQGSLQAGVILLEKPFSEDVLLTKVREVLDAQP